MLLLALYSTCDVLVDMVTTYFEAAQIVSELGSRAYEGGLVWDVPSIASPEKLNDTFANFYQYFCSKGESSKFVAPLLWVHCAYRPLSDLLRMH